MLKAGKGYRLQSGLKHYFIGKGRTNPNGLLLRGVVMATYVTDDEEHPFFEDKRNEPIAVYCDVLVYSNIANQRWFTLSRVLVSQKRGGMHNDDIWKPRATRQNIETTLNNTTGANVGSFDGDHVLVGFLNNSFEEPIILKGLPHPSRDINSISGNVLRLKKVDGDPDFVKHHGVLYGIDDHGNFIVDSIRGNNGSIDSTGKEPNPDTTGQSGNQTFNLPDNSKFQIILWDVSNPALPIESGKIEIQKNGGNIHVAFSGGETLTIDNKDNLATFKLGSGNVGVAIANHLETFYNNVKTLLATHIHNDSLGGACTVTTTVFPPWDSNIKSNKMTIPDNI